MTPGEIQSKLLGPCQQYGVTRLHLFGSAARQTATRTSDIDLLVQFREMSPCDYSHHYFAFLHEVEDALGRSVDLLTPGAIRRPSLHRNLSRDAILLYEA